MTQSSDRWYSCAMEYPHSLTLSLEESRLPHGTSPFGPIARPTGARTVSENRREQPGLFSTPEKSFQPSHPTRELTRPVHFSVRLMITLGNATYPAEMSNNTSNTGGIGAQHGSTDWRQQKGDSSGVDVNARPAIVNSMSNYPLHLLRPSLYF